MSQKPTPEQYLEDKKIKGLLQRIVLALLENRPDSPESYIVQMLSSKSKHEGDDEMERWPSLSG